MRKKREKKNIFDKKTLIKAARTISLVAVIAVVLFFCVGRPIYNITKEMRNYQEVLKENEQLRVQADEMENSVKWLKTPEGVAGVAREYGMIAQGEESIIFPPDDEALTMQGKDTESGAKKGNIFITLLTFLLIIAVPIVIILYIKRRLKRKEEETEEEEDVYIKRK